MANLKTQKEPPAPKDPPDINVPDRFTREDAKRAALFLQDLLRANGSLSKSLQPLWEQSQAGSLSGREGVL